MKLYTNAIILTKCSRECPHYKYDDGGGHCEESSYCIHPSRIVNNRYKEIIYGKDFINGFPKWCPIQNIDLCFDKEQSLCSSDGERLNWSIRTLRELADLPKSTPLGERYADIISVISTLKTVLQPVLKE